MADLVNHKNRMSKSSPILGHMHAESNTMASGYAGAFQFWKSKEQGDQPQSTFQAPVNPGKQPESPTLGPMRISRLSITSNTSTASSSRDPSPFNLYSSTLSEIDEDEENSHGTITRERSYSVAVMPRSSRSPELNPMNRKKPDIKLGCSMDELEELEEFYELDKPISGTSSEVSGLDSAPQSVSSVQSTSVAQAPQSPKKIERKLRSRDESVSVPKLILAHSASAADTLNPRHKINTPVALSARTHRRRLSHSDNNKGGALLSPKPNFVHYSNFRGIKNFNVPLHEVPNVKDQASIPQLLHDSVAFLRRSEIDLNTIIDAQRKNTNTPEWNELEAMLIEKKAVIDFSTLDNSDTPLAIQMIKWFFIHLPESILTNYRLRAFKDALEIDDDRVCTNMLQSLIHSLPEQNFLVVRFMIEFFKLLVSMLGKGVSSPPSSLTFDGPLSNPGSPQIRPGYKTIIEKIFAAFYPMFLCHPENDEPFDLPSNNNQSDAGPASGSGYLAVAHFESESHSRGRKKSHESKKDKRRSLAALPAHKKEELELQLMGLAPSSASSPSISESRKRHSKSDDFGYNKISNVRVTNEKLFQKGSEALEKRLFFLLITQYEKIFLCHDFGIEFSRQQNNIVVSSADPDRLVSLLLDPFYCKQDKTFVEQFFMTHEYFMTKEALLTCLVNDLRKRTGVKPWESKQRERILLRIKQWTNQEGLSIVKDRAFLTLMRKTLKEISFKATTTVTEKELIESALMTLVNIQRTYDAMTLRRESAILNTAKYELNIWKHNPSVLAQQMTLLDRQLIKTICGSEFLHGAHMKAELSPNYHQMVQKFNQISNWVAHEIVSQRDMSERVEALQYFIKLTKELVALSNYNSAYAVYLGLSMQVVTRLTLTWDKLNKKHTLRHKRLARLFDMNFNFHEYRKNLEADKEKCPIPVLALIPKDIIRFETDSTLTKNGQVDMEKMKGIWHGYFFLRQSQNNINICSIQRVEDVFRFFSDSSFEVSEKELNKLSKKCEPKTIKATKKASVH